VTFSVGGDDCGRAEVVNIGTIGLPMIRRLYYSGSMMNRASRGIGRLDEARREYTRAWLGRIECEDALAVKLYPRPGQILMLVAGFAKEGDIPRGFRRPLTQVSLHLENAFRRRHRPRELRAVIAANGKILHRAEGAETIASQAAKQLGDIESIRRAPARFGENLLDLWPALVGGEASLVEKLEGTRREYHVVANAGATRPTRSFTTAELEAVELAARGLPVKAIAYSLGVSSPTVSSRLASAAAKIGLASRLDLIRIAAAFCRDPRAGFDDATLSGAERDVLELVTDGKSNREIAEARNRSVRTIANQVASLLRKTAAPCRRALVAWSAGES
jgi:DNA-binding NarL/FixJ family response regulator